jgi:hypothetical protein
MAATSVSNRAPAVGPAFSPVPLSNSSAINATVAQGPKPPSSKQYLNGLPVRYGDNAMASQSSLKNAAQTPVKKPASTSTIQTSRPTPTHSRPPVSQPARLMNVASTQLMTNTVKPVRTSATPAGPSSQSMPKPSDTSPAEPAVATAGVKRRLGMGRTTGGYVNKRFKPPMA